MVDRSLPKHARRLRSVGVKLIAFDDASSSGHRSFNVLVVVRHRHLHRELHRHSIQREAPPDLVETQSSAAALLALRAAEAS
jgi:hypothetical protein